MSEMIAKAVPKYPEKDLADTLLYRNTSWILYKLFPDAFRLMKQILLLSLISSTRMNFTFSEKLVEKRHQILH
jgi:hypothetical protein